MEIKKDLEKLLYEIVDGFGLPVIEINISISGDHGDFTTNLPMRLDGKLGTPIEAGEKIINALKKYKDYEYFQKIEVVSPGFINFWLSDDELIRGTQKIIDFCSSRKKSEESLIMEFGDLNPFKEPHIGHLRNLSLGESIARIKESAGVSVIRANYEGDVGMHVAKCIYGIWQMTNEKWSLEEFEDKSLEERAKILGECYAKGAKAFEEDELAKKEIVSINNKIYSKDSEIMEIWEKGRRWSLDYFEVLYRILGVKYDKYYFESEIAEHGKEIVVAHPDVFEKDNDAYVFRGESYRLHTRVFLNSNGNPTYEAKDLGLAFAKDKDFPQINKSIIMTANEQIEYFKVLINALSKINSNLSEKTLHLSYGFIDLKEGKMSSRSGNIVSAFWLIEETRKNIKDGFREVSEDVLDSLSVASVKWSMLKFSRTSNIKFSIDESVDLAGNSGPYMLYSYARSQSILDKKENYQFEANFREKFSPESLALIRLVCQFEIVVDESSKTFSPNLLCNFLYEIAQKFNSFYEKEKIIGSSKESEKLAVVYAVGVVMRKGLFLLGIDAPKKI